MLKSEDLGGLELSGGFYSLPHVTLEIYNDESGIVTLYRKIAVIYRTNGAFTQSFQ